MAEESIVITDTSVLINFLVLDKVGLLPRLPNRALPCFQGIETPSVASRNLRPFHRRRTETDREIRFVTPAAWGFEHDRPGARWIGCPQPPAVPVAEDVPIDEPPPSEFEPGEGET